MPRGGIHRQRRVPRNRIDGSIGRFVRNGRVGRRSRWAGLRGIKAAALPLATPVVKAAQFVEQRVTIGVRTGHGDVEEFLRTEHNGRRGIPLRAAVAGVVGGNSGRNRHAPIVRVVQVGDSGISAAALVGNDVAGSSGGQALDGDVVGVFGANVWRRLQAGIAGIGRHRIRRSLVHLEVVEQLATEAVVDADGGRLVQLRAGRIAIAVYH